MLSVCDTESMNPTVKETMESTKDIHNKQPEWECIQNLCEGNTIYPTRLEKKNLEVKNKKTSDLYDSELILQSVSVNFQVKVDRYHVIKDE